MDQSFAKIRGNEAEGIAERLGSVKGLSKDDAEIVNYAARLLRDFKTLLLETSQTRQEEK